MKRFIVIVSCFLIAVGSTNGAILDFTGFAGGPSGITFDADGDAIDDVQFTSGDGSPFNPTGPGLNQVYIIEPGLEGTSLAVPYDLRVDFLVGAVGQLQFGFAVDSGQHPGDTATFRVFDAGDTELASIVVVAGGSPPSSFPEGQVTLPFAGMAAYATFDFTSDYGRYIIDNLEGTYGSAEITLEVEVDIKGGSCPNPFNPKSRGSVPVAIVGSEDLDVETIDPSSICLLGPGGMVCALEGFELEDSTQPSDSDPADCYDCFDADDPDNFNCDLIDATDPENPVPGQDGIMDSYCGDGYMDLVVKFDTQALKDAIGPADREDCVELVLIGSTLEGRDITGMDSMRILMKIN